MNTEKINQLKATLDAAVAAYNAKKEELTLQGLKSAERYPLLKELRDARNVANSVYVDYTHGQINRELEKIIRSNRKATPSQRAQNWATSYARQQAA